MPAQPRTRERTAATVIQPVQRRSCQRMTGSHLSTVYRAGHAATVTPNVADILRRAPRSLANFVHDHQAVVTNDA